ncbi:MAG TPA: dihydrodipicolinate synthase family protein [Chitinophagaceae bacterium]|nr:dihydrodipicolinate synthase family protein [Chitinophagaceae bacterium]
MTRREVLTIASSLIASGIIANINPTNTPKSMTSNNKLPDGVLSAVLTPLDNHLNADHSRLINHIKWLLKRGNNGIGLLGTTGEANSFSVGERLKILEAVLDGGIPSDKLIVGTGCCAITDTVTLTRHAQSHGVAGILLLPPFYYKKINDAGLETYMAKFFDGVGDNNVQICLYHFPQLAGVPFSVSLVERLVSKYPKNIIGLKDSGGDWSHMEQLLKAIPGFRLYTGNEKFLLPVLKAGGAGCISANANFTSPEAAAVYEAWKKGRGEKEQARLSMLRDALDTYPSIGTLKYIFAKWSGVKDWLNVRPPNAILTDEEGSRIEQKLKEINYYKTF